MKKGLLGLTFFLLLQCFAFSQEVQYTAVNTYYGNPFESSTGVAALGSSFTHRTSGASNQTLSVTNSPTALNGSQSLATVNRATPLANAIQARLLPSSANFSGSVTYEWSFLYKYTTSNNSADIVDYSNVITGNCGWRYWLAANNNNPSSTGGKGLFLTQIGSSLIFRSKEGDFYTRDITSTTLSPNTTYSIKCRVINNGICILFVDAVTSTKREATTKISSSNFGVGIDSYSFTLLEANEARSTSTLRCQWDELKLYVPTVTVTSLNSTTTNNINNAQLQQGQKSAIVYGFSVASRGVFNFKSLSVASNLGNNSECLAGVKLYSSPTAFFSLSTATLIGSPTVDGGSSLALTTNIDHGGTEENGTLYYYFYTADLNTNSRFSGKILRFNGLGLNYDNHNNSTSTTTAPSNGNDFTINQSYIWTGNTNTTFGTATNWKLTQLYQADQIAGSAPSSSSYAYIPSSATSNPTSSTDVTLGGLILESGKTLTLNDANLTINNNLVSDGTIAFTGTVDKTFTIGSAATSSLANLSIVKNGIARTVTLASTNSNLNLTGTLNLQNATLITNGKLTLKSSGTQTASISRLDQTTSGIVDAAITGNVTAERFVTGGSSYNSTRGNFTYRNYRIMSSPVINSTSPAANYTLTYIASSSIVTGATGGYTSSGNPTLYLYREDYNGNSTSFTSGNFRGITALNAAVTVDGGSAYLYPGTGFLFYFRGDKTNNLTLKTTSPFVGPENVVFSNTGTVNQGNISFKNWKTGNAGLSYSTVNDKVTARGLNLVGNPYPSSISWTAVYAASSNIDGTIYSFDPVTGQYGSYTQGAGTGTNNASNVISSGVGFFVKANNSSGVVNFRESSKITTQNTGNALLLGLPVQNTKNQSHLKLQLIKDSLNYDEVVVGFRQGAVADYDEAQDAYDLGGSGALESMSVVSGANNNEINLASKYYPYPKKQQEISLLVDATSSGRFTLSLKEIKDMPKVYHVWLKDAYMKDSLDIKNNPNYVFDIEKGNPATYGNSRLKLVIKQVNDYRFLALSAERAVDGVLLKWKTEKEYDYLTFTVERSTDGGKTFMPLGSVQSNGNGAYSFVDKYPVLGVNVYRIKQDDFNNEISYSKDANITYEDKVVTGEVLTVYPNPTPDNLNIKITSALTGGSYNIRIANSRGDFVKQITISQQSWQGNVTDLLPGTYFIQVIDNKTQSVVGSSKFTKI